MDNTKDVSLTEIAGLLKLLNQKFLLDLANSPYKEKNTVLGWGRPSSKIVLVGEAPGGEEEKKGAPFVGSAGKHLDEFLKVLKLPKNSLYITNVVKFRPVKPSKKTGKAINRSPNKEEIMFCQPFLWEELRIIKPQIVITLGNYALRAVLNDNKISIGAAHGYVIEKENYAIYPLYHPASVIYNQALKQVYIDDLHKLTLLIGKFNESM